MKRHCKSARIRFLIIVGALVLFRMFLVAQDEISAIGNDSVNYAKNSLHYLSGNVYDSLPSQLAGISLLARWGTQLGIPYKLLLEGILLMAAFAAAGVVFRLTGSAIYRLLVFVLTLFNPWFIQSSRMFMSEPAVSILLLLLIVSASPFLLLPAKRWSLAIALLATIVSVIFVLVRPELPLLTGFWVLTFLAVVLCQPKRIHPSRFLRPVQWRLGLLTLPFVSALIATHVMKYIHYKHYGVYALHSTEAPGLRQLMNALYSIPPTESIRFAPVTRQSLAVACDASPTLATYRDALLNVNAVNYQYAQRSLGLKGEFGSWLNWHLINSFRGMHYESNLRMATAAHEIREAQQNGNLARRTAFFPVDPLMDEWLPEIPEKSILALNVSFQPRVDISSFEQYSQERRVESSVEFGFFDDGLLRRPVTGENYDIRIYGYLPAASSNFKEVRLLDQSDRVIEVSPVVERSSNRFFPERCNVSLIIPEGSHLLHEPLRLEFVPRYPDSETRHIVDIRAAFWNRTFNLKCDQDQTKNEAWQISVSAINNQSGVRKYCQDQIRQHYDKMTVGFAVIAFVLGAVRHTSRRNARGLFWLVFIGAGLLAGRCSYYVLIEVWLKWGLPRYLEPNVLLAMFVLLCFAYLMGNWTRRILFNLRSRVVLNSKMSVPLT